MLDLKLVKENLEEVAEKLKKRGFALDVAAVKTLEEDRRSLIHKAETLKSEKNGLSKQIGELKKNKQDASEVMAKVKELGESVSAAEKEAEAKAESRVKEILGID